MDSEDERRARGVCAPSVQIEIGRRSRGVQLRSRRPEVRVGRTNRNRKPGCRRSSAPRKAKGGEHHKKRGAIKPSSEVGPSSQYNGHYRTSGVQRVRDLTEAQAAGRILTQHRRIQSPTLGARTIRFRLSSGDPWKDALLLTEPRRAKCAGD